jgi:hypothetical protein
MRGRGVTPEERGVAGVDGAVTQKCRRRTRQAAGHGPAPSPGKLSGLVGRGSRTFDLVIRVT